MKRFCIVVLAVTCLILSPKASFAGEIVEGMAERVVRGATNLITGVLEIPFQIGKGYSNGVGFIENEPGSKLVGTVLGIFRGLSHAVGRSSSGAIELVGFWAASPEDNSGVGVPLDAEYAWEEGTQYSIFEPNLGEGIKPWFRKFGRGVGNGLLGILEVPGQIKKGAEEGNVLVGAVKGLWYWPSRGVYGISNIATSFVPNPEDNKGVHFEEEWPWEALTE